MTNIVVLNCGKNIIINLYLKKTNKIVVLSAWTSQVCSSASVTSFCTYDLKIKCNVLKHRF